MSEVVIIAKDDNHSNVYLSNEQLHNYRKLAAYLLKVKPTKSFDMGFFAYKHVIDDDEEGFSFDKGIDPDDVLYLVNSCKLEQHDCGTAGCAIGHAVFAGIGKDDKDLAWLSWWAYASKYFGADDGSDVFTWCFDSEWKLYDNTPTGAAKRILYMLENGAPSYRWSLTDGIHEGYYDTGRYDPAPAEA